jgi:hypothetical protein
MVKKKATEDSDNPRYRRHTHGDLYTASTHHPARGMSSWSLEPGFGADFPGLREPPAPNVSLPMYFYRRFVSPVDAVREWGVSRFWAPECDVLRREIATRVAKALGPIDVNKTLTEGWRPFVVEFRYAAARKIIKEWQRRHRVPNGASARRKSGLVSEMTWETNGILALLDAYEDPARYLERVFAGEGEDGETIQELKPLSDFGVARSLYLFGFSALLSPEVRETFLALSPQELMKCVAYAEGRRRFKAGGVPQGKSLRRQSQYAGLPAEVVKLERHFGKGDIAWRRQELKGAGIDPARLNRCPSARQCAILVAALRRNRTAAAIIQALKRRRST